MASWINAFFPTFALMAIGFGLRRTVLPDPNFWIGAERLAFYVLLPSLLTWSISTVDLGRLPVAGLAATVAVPLLAATVLSVGIARLRGHDGPTMTSVVQGGIRFNTYVALPIVGAILGPTGLAFAGVTSGLIVTLVQTILTVVFVFGTGGKASPRRVGRGLVTNPLILGCLTGFGFAAAGGMPPGLEPLARALGQAGLAIGLLCVGAGLVLGSLREEPATQLLTALLKLGLVPVATFMMARAVGLDPLPATAAVFVMAMPTASTSFVMARAMGGNARLMAAIITWQHLLAVATLPLWAFVLAA